MTQSRLPIAAVALLLCGVLYAVVNGAGLYETLMILPVWKADPPRSFGILHQLPLKEWWTSLHAVHELSFIAALVLAWPAKALRKPLLGWFGLHMAARVWTLAYFAPQIMAFQATPATADPAPLLQAAQDWAGWNWLRVWMFTIANIGVLRVFWKAMRMQPVAG